MSLESLDSTFNEEPDPQYSITFEHDTHGELIIDHELVETIDDILNEERLDYAEELNANIGIDVVRSRGRGRGRVTNSDISGKEFSVNLAWELIKDTLVIEKSTSYDEASPQTLPETSSKGKRTVYVTKKFELPLTRLLDDEHFVEWKQKREACVYCRYLSQRGKKAVNYDNPHKATYSAPSVKYLSSVLSKDHTALKIFTRKKINGIILLFLSHSLHLIRFFF
ncbi:piggybac transposable element-derived protein 4-like [Gigaspora margarita]|uniref:Piggybac transposable element-derived protein 4-like n=1 Tax=Gigaspora margarita TaxID=4874 RepID=A0A8H4AM87_GIGMA|nr:piggybac transposable element-derived protein 4-like [Gigaspora margarita]